MLYFLLALWRTAVLLAVHQPQYRPSFSPGVTEIHYATEKGQGRACGNRVLGIDKGYTEAFTDSDGDHHGQDFGKVMTEYSDKVAKTGKQRNKLHALEKKHRAAGRIAKADRIKKNNLGRQKIDARQVTTQKQLRTIAYQAAHSIVDKAAVVASEDLTAAIASKHQWKRFNRRMSACAKGILAEALDSVCEQRHAKHILVNGAYTSQMTSQMDSTNGLLQGKRVGEKFYRANNGMGGRSPSRPSQALRCSERAGKTRGQGHQPIHTVSGSPSNPAGTFCGATERQEGRVGCASTSTIDCG
ncbi:MAG: hypothetical protein LRY49_09195 [Burkholderiaceae bacterium]|nr:hypothetical protein [Burkholderiaceae bacterium]